MMVYSKLLSCKYMNTQIVYNGINIRHHLLVCQKYFVHWRDDLVIIDNFVLFYHSQIRIDYLLEMSFFFVMWTRNKADIIFTSPLNLLKEKKKKCEKLNCRDKRPKKEDKWKEGQVGLHSLGENWRL